MHARGCVLECTPQTRWLGRLSPAARSRRRSATVRIATAPLALHAGGVQEGGVPPARRGAPRDSCDDWCGVGDWGGDELESVRARRRI